jgi:hypothetical protein
MKTLCAWCGSTIRVNCDHCGAPLLSANYIGCTITTDTAAMICLNAETPLVYTARAIERMHTSHGICQKCRELPEKERDALLAARRVEDQSIPRSADLVGILSQSQVATDHEQSTRALRQAHRQLQIQTQTPPAKKRGPTPPNPRDADTHTRHRKKSDGAA